MRLDRYCRKCIYRGEDEYVVPGIECCDMPNQLCCGITDWFAGKSYLYRQLQHPPDDHSCAHRNPGGSINWVPVRSQCSSHCPAGFDLYHKKIYGSIWLHSLGHIQAAYKPRERLFYSSHHHTLSPKHFCLGSPDDLHSDVIHPPDE